MNQDSSHSALVRVLRELLSPEFPLIDVYPIVSTSLFREACWHSPKALLLSQYERRMFEYMNSQKIKKLASQRSLHVVQG